MPSGDKAFIKSQESARKLANVDASDYIKIPKRILYKTFCNHCNADRGYLPLKQANKPFCMQCASDWAGKYNRSEEQKQSFKERMFLLKPRVGTRHTPETRDLLRQKQIAYCKEFGNQFAGRRHSETTKNKLSHLNSGQSPKWKGRIFQYDGPQGFFKLRSSWELAYANWLDAQNINWIYEPKFTLSNGKTYSPDFLLENGNIIEIKGFWTEKALAKWSLFSIDYPDLNKQVLEEVDLLNLGILNKKDVSYGN